MGLVGEFPRTQLICSRLVRVGDYVATPDGRFEIVDDVRYVGKTDTVTIEFDNGIRWFGDDDRPFAVAIAPAQAAEWNRRHEELHRRQRIGLHSVPA
jgi:mannitol/fructose-specific phosphotransferase system IIA component